MRVDAVFPSRQFSQWARGEELDIHSRRKGVPLSFKKKVQEKREKEFQPVRGHRGGG